jgi:hypothetical protein
MKILNDKLLELSCINASQKEIIKKNDIVIEHLKYSKTL